MFIVSLDIFDFCVQFVDFLVFLFELLHLKFEIVEILHFAFINVTLDIDDIVFLSHCQILFTSTHIFLQYFFELLFLFFLVLIKFTHQYKVKNIQFLLVLFVIVAIFYQVLQIIELQFWMFFQILYDFHMFFFFEMFFFDINSLGTIDLHKNRDLLIKLFLNILKLLHNLIIINTRNTTSFLNQIFLNLVDLLLQLSQQPIQKMEHPYINIAVFAFTIDIEYIFDHRLIVLFLQNVNRSFIVLFSITKFQYIIDLFTIVIQHSALLNNI